jgi:hypothetical protein
MPTESGGPAEEITTSNRAACGGTSSVSRRWVSEEFFSEPVQPVLSPWTG